MSDLPTSPEVLAHLTSEINRISKQQNEALRMAAFVRMTEQESREYDQRSQKLAELLNELAPLTSQRLP